MRGQDHDGTEGGLAERLLLDPVPRAAAIEEFDLGETIHDSHLAAICRFVAHQCAMPIALVSLVDIDEQRFLGRADTDWTRTPHSPAFSATAMLNREPTVVPDARLDPRFADYPIVAGEPSMRFYAGAPLVTAEGVALGALCVLDTKPHPEGLSADQREMLVLMAESVMDRLSLRRVRRNGFLAARDAQDALSESELRFRLLADAMPQIAWSSRPDGFTDYFNARWYEFTGLPEGASKGDEWAQCLHPDDFDRTLAVWRQSVDTGEPYDLEYRLRRADGVYRWTLTRGIAMHDVDGHVVRWFGTCTDIHDHRMAMEEREIVSQELSHRIKNIFAVISGLIGLSARDQPLFKPTADGLRARIMALGRAHDFVRPHSRDSMPDRSRQDSLHALLGEIFAPYETSPGERVAISGLDVRIDDRSATPLALLFHEMGTNAAKYGALSTPDGRVTLTIERSGEGESSGHILMHWSETGGPALGAPMTPGFGSRLLDLSVRRQLGGDFEQNWAPDGLKMTVRVPLTAFSRNASR
ncbi:hypothetical protein BH10PSE13_BH10PSE13_00630 [soil metagenome]